ncbi:PhzF family phenazine biosynthesis protein [Melghirimyces profundicolus]|uniref:PhzF family phenazine biosynthesis protein n=1 Tax=Melghirimyces profundicolus TaxID=1242148 RepID=A0A2T6APQ0_9BACL|nr:PhzF family phenazine biosynthesis protein [Melghirimyces profundicolus]PTX45760.1 PhzF family phenazine biosynthesis protein [Melghirimyces profundicolus]
MGQKIIQVNAFTDRPFSGNPAAVCVMPGPADENWMRLVAREMNLPETAFLYPEGDGYHLRWFTPVEEEDLCGHATLASAHVLWEEGRFRPEETLRFHTRSGLLTARRSGGRIELDFPAEPVHPVEIPPSLKEAFGDRIRFLGANHLDCLMELASETEVRGFDPDHPSLQSLPYRRGLIVTSASESGKYDIISRFFAPNHGIPEDPATGSAHCALGPYWTERLGKPELHAFQASERGGILHVRPEGDRVRLAGQAVTVWRGELAGEK